jgi:hypothetical protein
MLYVRCIQCDQKFSFSSEIEKNIITERIKSPWLDLANNMSIPEFRDWLRSSNFKFEPE